MVEDIVAYKCPKCKKINDIVTKTCSCGYMVLENDSGIKSYSENEILKREYFYNLIKSFRIPFIIYSLLLIIFIISGTQGKIILSLTLFIFGIINTLIPLKRLLIYNRVIAAICIFLGIFSTLICSYNSDNIDIKKNLKIMKNSSLNQDSLDLKSDQDIYNFMNECENLDYENVFRDIDKFSNKKIKCSGQIAQIIDDKNNNFLRINVTYLSDLEVYKNSVWVDCSSIKEKFLEWETVDVWGNIKGKRPFNTYSGSIINIPEIKARNILRKEK